MGYAAEAFEAVDAHALATPPAAKASLGALAPRPALAVPAEGGGRWERWGVPPFLLWPFSEGEV